MNIVTKALLATAFIQHCSAMYCKVKQRADSQTTKTIAVTKGLAVNLTWHYALSGCIFSNQRLGYDSRYGLVTLAIKRQNGSMEVTDNVKAHFSERVTTTTSGTLTIRNIQYNDSFFQFISTVSTHSPPIFHLISKRLLPKYVLFVTGAPSYTSFPKDEVEVEEGENLQVAAIVEAWPPPLVKFELSSLMKSVVLHPHSIYPFSYKAIFELKKIPSHHCGAQLTTEFYSNRGSSGIRHTAIKVKLNLKSPLGLTATIINRTCIQIKWKKRLSGACQVGYFVKLYNRSHHQISSQKMYSTDHHFYCNGSIHQVERVTLHVTYEGQSLTTSTHVEERQTTTSITTTSAPTTSIPNTSAPTTSIPYTSAPTPSKLTTAIAAKSSLAGFNTTIRTPFTVKHTSPVDKTAEVVVRTAVHNGVESGSTVAAIVAPTCIISLLIIVLAALLKWKLRRQSSRTQDISNSKVNGNGFKQETGTPYMDLKEMGEAPSYTALLDSEPKY